MISIETLRKRHAFKCQQRVRGEGGLCQGNDWKSGGSSNSGISFSV